MRIFAWLAAFLALVIATMLGVGFALASQAPHIGGTFLTLMAEGRAQDALLLTSPQTQKSRTAEDLLSDFADPLWETYRGTEWERRAFALSWPLSLSMHGRTHLANTAVDVDMTLLWQGNGWRVDRWKVQELQSAQTLPTAEEAATMIRDSMTLFSQAVQTNDFSPLYFTLDSSWKKQTNPEKLRKSFDPFLESGLDLGFIDTMSPELVADPSLDDHGDLLLRGNYVLENGTVLVDWRGRFVKNAWKLTGLQMKFAPNEGN